MGYQLKGCNSQLIEKRISFAPPPHDSVVKVINTKEDWAIEYSEVIESGDLVLVKGYFNVIVQYLTTNKGVLNKLMGKVEKQEEKQEEEQVHQGKERQAKENKEENESEEKAKPKHKKPVLCEPIEPEPQCMAVDGVVRHTTVWIPFEILVNVEGARPGDEATVTGLTMEKLEKKCRTPEIIEDDLIVGIYVNEVINVNVAVTVEEDKSYYY